MTYVTRNNKHVSTTWYMQLEETSRCQPRGICNYEKNICLYYVVYVTTRNKHVSTTWYLFDRLTRQLTFKNDHILLLLLWNIRIRLYCQWVLPIENSTRKQTDVFCYELRYHGKHCVSKYSFTKKKCRNHLSSLCQTAMPR